MNILFHCNQSGESSPAPGKTNNSANLVMFRNPESLGEPKGFTPQGHAGVNMANLSQEGLAFFKAGKTYKATFELVE